MRTSRRRTKIIATVGPASKTAGDIEKLLRAGADCLRVNCSHSSEEEIRKHFSGARKAERKVGSPLPILVDLQGPKIRLASSCPTEEVEVGQRFWLHSKEQCSPGEIPVAYEEFLSLLKKNSEVVLGDGVPRLKVLKVSQNRARVEVTAKGRLGPNIGATAIGGKRESSSLTEKDLRDLSLAAELGADFVALSFVRSADDIRILRQALESKGSKARVIAKIEKIEAYENLSEILDVSDGIMVARGDYGIEAGHASVPLMQKDALRRASREGKIAITATQMLQSMEDSALPTRAETADVANAVLDGTSAVMLSSETAVGSHPEEAARAMAEIISAVERDPSLYCVWLDSEDLRANPATAVMHAAVTLGRDTDAAAILVPTSSGGSARAAAKYRPKRPVVALTNDPTVARQLQLEWGTYAGKMKLTGNMNRLVDEALRAAQKTLPELQPGETVVVSSGTKQAVGATNVISLQELPNSGA